MTKIVVVEDQQVLAIVYRNKFVGAGYEVEVAADGEAGIALINSAAPDLVILDLMLPKVNGIGVLKSLRANPLFQALPVIVLSNASLPHMVDDAWKAGATMVLSKSNHSPNQIVESVRAALKAASERQSSASVGVTSRSASASRDLLIATQPLTTTGRILLVEDHPDTSALMSLLLDQVGHQTTIIQSQGGVLNKAETQQFDLFLLNGACADGAGITICRQLRQSHPQHPIVMYSTTALPAEQQAGLEAGASVYLTKPGDLLNIGKLLLDLLHDAKTLAG